MSEGESRFVNSAGQLKDEVDGVGIVIGDNIRPELVRSVLLMERGPNVRFSGQFENCGGSLEPGEEPLIASKREMAEELGVTPTEIIPLFSYKPFEDTQKEDHIYLATILEEPQIAEEDLGKCSRIVWTAIEALEELPLVDYAKYVFVRLGWIKEKINDNPELNSRK